MSSKVLETTLREQLLTCIICEDQYCDPRTLQCLHTFCLNCIKRWSSNRGSGDNVQCPTCRQVTDLISIGGANCLPKSFVLENLRETIERFENAFCPDEPQQCHYCAAKVTCKVCNYHLCEHCSQMHRLDPNTKEHRLIRLEQKLIRLDQPPLLKEVPKLTRSLTVAEDLENRGNNGLLGFPFIRSRSSDRSKGSSKFRTSERARSAERDARTNSQTATSYMERGNSTHWIIAAFTFPVPDLSGVGGLTPLVFQPLSLY